MKKSIFLLLGAGMFIFAACNKTEKTKTETESAMVTDNNEPVDNEAMYRERAKEVTSQMARDLKFDKDTAMQSQVSNVYYSRAKNRNMARGKYSSDTTGMHAEMRDIDLQADQEFQKILKPEQYKVYETNRTTYYGGFEETDMPSPGYNESGSTTMEAAESKNSNNMESSPQVRTKTEKDGDTKTEIETATSKTKIKTDADGDTKIKTKEK